MRDSRRGDQGAIDPGLRRRVSISDDGSPDAVYLDGDLGAPRRSAGRVVIEDENYSGRSTASRQPRRPMDSRLRDRRAAIRRAIGRKRLTRLSIAGIVVLVGVAALAVLGSSWFGVRRSEVYVTGKVYTNTEQLNEIIDGAVGTPVILVDTTDIEVEIESIAWVADAAVRTKWPFGLEIDIRERTPVLSYPGSDGLFRVLDSDGRVLDVIDGWPFNYLLLVCNDVPLLTVGEFAPAGPVGAAALGASLTGSIRDRVSLIEVDAAGTDLRVTLDDDTKINFGAARELFPKLVRLETVMSAGGVLPGSVIDVSTDEVTVS